MTLLETILFRGLTLVVFILNGLIIFAKTLIKGTCRTSHLRILDPYLNAEPVVKYTREGLYNSYSKKVITQ